MKKNIVIVCYKYPPEYSGYGLQLKSILDKMNLGRLNITILTVHSSSKSEQTNNIRIISLGNDNNQISTYAFSFRAFIWLVKNRNKYSLIHCIKAGPEAIASNIISKIFSKKIIVKVAQDEMSDREIGSSKGLIRFNRKLRHKILSNVDYFVAISEEINKSLKQRISRSSHVLRIPNGVDIEKYKPIGEKQKKELKLQLNIEINESPIILFAGAINKRKGVHDLLKAIDLLDEDINCTFIFCGPILEKIDFMDYVEQYNENIKLIYAGKVSNLNQFMKISDIFILPSYSEGLPNVLLEAAASGLALLSTDIGGNRDIVKDSVNGFLVSTNDSKSLKEKVEILIKRENIRKEMGNNSRKIAVNKFNLDKIAKTYSDLYYQLTKDV
ncbi:glycosyltransferase [Oceanobacillus kimchii]|uniref:Glycosyl transferase family 1 domain-containing protein n=1 Tax=Oceanobacillus kimchii TaxID=746691 RepID=A0ABQ5TND6_9BACI|nr:glycosyltransferase [Oceanobacillus kimchii]GLO67575.1 hypothetical protein MACH08_33590 [Oceanobacillus kimchii]